MQVPQHHSYSTELRKVIIINFAAISLIPFRNSVIVLRLMFWICVYMYRLFAIRTLYFTSLAIIYTASRSKYHNRMLQDFDMTASLADKNENPGWWNKRRIASNRFVLLQVFEDLGMTKNNINPSLLGISSISLNCEYWEWFFFTTIVQN